MRTVRSAVLLLASLALSACAVPKFPAADSSSTTPVNPPPPDDTFTCEDQSQYECSATSGSCGKICHYTNVQRVAKFKTCDSVVIDGARYDNCVDGTVCLEPDPHTAQGYLCLPLCKSTVDCDQGVACGDRRLTDTSTITVCDPPYQSCSGTCCDPLDASRYPCPSSRSCYLVPALNVGRDNSWTVCEYSGGAASPGENCTWARDCVLGSTCVGVENGVKNTGKCRAVCDPDPSILKPCGEGGTCKPFPKEWGYCL
jgi:hypothetical protein